MFADFKVNNDCLLDMTNASLYSCRTRDNALKRDIPVDAVLSWGKLIRRMCGRLDVNLCVSAFRTCVENCENCLYIIRPSRTVSVYSCLHRRLDDSYWECQIVTHLNASGRHLYLTCLLLDGSVCILQSCVFLGLTMRYVMWPWKTVNYWKPLKLG
jgi:hypothetical protein